MNNSGFDYLLRKSLGDNNKLSLYYDFNTGNAFYELGPENLVGQSKTLSNWSTGSTTIIVTGSGIAPDGTQTSSNISVLSGSTNGSLVQTVNVNELDTGTYTFSVYAMSGDSKWLRVDSWFFDNNLSTYFNLTGTTGTIGTSSHLSNGYPAGLTKETGLSGDFYRAWVSFPINADPTGQIRLFSAEGNGDPFWSDNSGYSGIYIWGARLNRGNRPQSGWLHTTTPVTGKYSGFLHNVYPSRNSGNNNLLLENITDISETGIAKKLTGNFLMGGESGDFTLSNGKITGINNFKLKNSTFLFSTQKTKGNAGILFGSLRKREDTDSDTLIDYDIASGINIGINARNQLFVNGIGGEGEYTFTADEIELANKNICSVSIGDDLINFAKYDLASNTVEQQAYPVQTNFIQDRTGDLLGYLGGGDNIDFYNYGNNYSGIIDKFAVFSGVIDPNSCLYMSSGFACDLDYQSGGVTSIEVFTGNTSDLVYTTGYTGVQAIITGYINYKTGAVTKTFKATTGTFTNQLEGTLYKTGKFLSNGFVEHVLEEEGLIIDDLQYTTTGDSAHATLGLKDTGGFLNYTESIVYETPDVSGIALYYLSGLTGLILETPTGAGIGNLTQTIYRTGSESFAIIPNTGKFLEYKYNFLYYLGERNVDSLFDYVTDSGLFIDPNTIIQKGQRNFNDVAIETNDQLKVAGTMNSQTLLEIKPNVKTVGFEEIIKTTGDFYISGFKLELDETITGLDQQNFIYDTSQTGNILYSVFSESGTLQTGFMANLGSGISGQDFEPVVYINGQKVYSGITYYRDSDTFIWNDKYNTTGRMFSHSKAGCCDQYFGTGKYDVSGVNIKYNKNTTKLFVNGLQQDNNMFIEAGNIVPITTGLQSQLTASSGVFVKQSIVF